MEVPRRPQLKMPCVRPNMASNHHPSTPTAAVGPMGVVISRVGWCAGRYGAPAGLYGSIRAIWGGTAVGENRYQPPYIGAFPAAKAPNFGSLGTEHRVQCAPRPIGWSQHPTSPRWTEVGVDLSVPFCCGVRPRIPLCSGQINTSIDVFIFSGQKLAVRRAWHVQRGGGSRTGTMEGDFRSFGARAPPTARARLIPVPVPREPIFAPRCGSMVSTGSPRLTTAASMTPKILGVGHTVLVTALTKSYASGVPVGETRGTCVRSECACATIWSRRNVRDTRKGAAVAPAAGGRRTCGLRG